MSIQTQRPRSAFALVESVWTSVSPWMSLCLGISLIAMSGCQSLQNRDGLSWFGSESLSDASRNNASRSGSARKEDSTSDAMRKDALRKDAMKKDALKKDAMRSNASAETPASMDRNGANEAAKAALAKRKQAQSSPRFNTNATEMDVEQPDGNQGGLSPTMKIRGQSPTDPAWTTTSTANQAGSTTPGSDDQLRTPMAPSGGPPRVAQGTWPTTPGTAAPTTSNFQSPQFGNPPSLAPGNTGTFVPGNYGAVPSGLGAPLPPGNYPVGPNVGPNFGPNNLGPNNLGPNTVGPNNFGNAPIGTGAMPPTSPSDFGNQPFPQGSGVPLSLEQPWQLDRGNSNVLTSPSTGYQPNIRNTPVDIHVQEGQTGRFVFGGSVNTDLGVAGQIILEERNFDIRRLPRSGSDLFNGAFRGNGENFRLEAMPGNRVQRYSINWTQPNLFGYSPWSLSLGGFLFTRLYRDWSEQRLGARGMLGYQLTPDLSFSTELRAENVTISNPRVRGVAELENVLGHNDMYTGRFRLAHNTRDSQFLPTEGHYLEFIYDQVFGSFDYPRGQINYSKYFLLRERADGGGRHTLTSSWKFGFSGSQTPIYENFFAGGFTTMRGFSFRGASPLDNGVQVGGRFMFLGSLEYMFPLTADDMLRMVTFVDYGTIEQDIEIHGQNFRVAPGAGLRVAIPALGPGPLAFDFAFPVAHAPTDDRQVFSFSVGITR